MTERARLIAFLRGEIVGPAVPLLESSTIQFTDRTFTDPQPKRRGAVVWQPTEGAPLEEVLYYNSEPPNRKYGIGLLHPAGASSVLSEVAQAAQKVDTGVDDQTSGEDEEVVESEEDADGDMTTASMMEMPDDDFEVASPDLRRPSTVGLSFCADLPESAELVVRIPRVRKFPWQLESDPPFPVNGRYEVCEWVVAPDGASPRKARAWRRLPAMADSTEIRFSRVQLAELKPLTAVVPLAEGSPLRLTVELYPRRLNGYAERFLITVVLRNRTGDSVASSTEAVLFQTYFQVHAEEGTLAPYPESGRPFDKLDDDEKSLALLYRDSAVWGIGHGCAAGWDSEPGETPGFVYVDVMPAVETPNMTPNIVSVDGKALQLKMRDLATLAEDGHGRGWDALCNLSDQYRLWIQRTRATAAGLKPELSQVATRHLDACQHCLDRIERGIERLNADPLSRRAFRLANRAMLLQQIASKVLERRGLEWSAKEKRAKPSGTTQSPIDIFNERSEGEGIGVWRAFQVAFMLMQLDGMADPESTDREIIDLIWFPTGGGKTEAYLAVAAFHMFHQRLLMEDVGHADRDGTNVLMRYTLRMLTTQQFQRAASLICSMEYLRRQPECHGEGRIAGQRFGLGLWIGSEGSPKDELGAKTAVAAFEKGDGEGNPLVLTECPWCRSEIGGIRRRGSGSRRATAGITPNGALLCPDARCSFGGRRPEEWLPVEVVDSRIYESCPSMIIATADKFALLAYRPKAGAIYGRELRDGVVRQKKRPPALIIQDELHLIAGPLGTIYGLYEGVIEALCSQEIDDKILRPKILASTATIRGASAQTRALYARSLPDGTANVQLFPAPGISMGDSFFGKYDRRPDGRLSPGRLYLGVHANEFGSILTAQVRVFAAALAMAQQMPPDKQDAWWTLLAFYNSLRELGGAKTLFDSDIRSRLKFIQNREAIEEKSRRTLRSAEELTSRLSQAEIVGMLDKLSVVRGAPGAQAVDSCLASSIIEVGVDIDRLSLLGVIGQPKTTAQYIQVTGRVGRRWWDRPGLVLMLYSPSKSRDRSHYEQFHSYHRRLYERVEPTSATPFATSAIQRALAGALLSWARQATWSTVTPDLSEHWDALNEAKTLLVDRCHRVQTATEAKRSIAEIEAVYATLVRAMRAGPASWEKFPPSPDEEYLLLWPGQYYTKLQRQRGIQVPSSMRQVDNGSEFLISSMYAVEHPPVDLT